MATDAAIAEVRADLAEIFGTKKCKGCECLLDVLESLQGDLVSVQGSVAEAARAEMKRWFEAGSQHRHNCLGCEVCLPIEPYNRLSALLQQRSGQITLSAAPAEAHCDFGGA